MAYCTNSEIIAMTGSALDATTIDDLIAETDLEIDEYVVDVNLLSIPTPTPRTISLASKYLTASKVIYRQKHDGTQPNTLRAGNYYEDVDVDKTAELYEKRGKALLMSYVLGRCPENAVLIKTD